MDIQTTTVTTKTHRATVGQEELKGVAIAAAKIKLGLVGDASALVIASQANVNADGSISIEIVEKAGDDAPKPVEASAPVAAPAVVATAQGEPALVSPVAEPAAAPTLHAPSFAKVA